MWNILYSLILIFPNVFCEERIHLHNGWTVRNSSQTRGVDTNIPSGVYSDLQNAGVIGDIYFKNNDVNLRWVANTTWIYQHSFIVDDIVLKSENKYLIFEGVDTFAKIFLNEQLLGETNNMFVRYKFNINLELKESNNLTVVIQSPIQMAKSIFKQQSENYVVPPVCVPDNYNGECHVNHIRKMQASFAWDWGPAFPSLGIWKPVYIEYFNKSAVIRNIIVETNLINNNWSVNVTVFMETNETSVLGIVTAEFQTNIETIKVNAQEINKPVHGEIIQSIVAKIPENAVDLWWPNGYGCQKMYELTVKYVSEDNKEVSSKAIKIGYRTIKLIQDKVEGGLSFYFEVNKLPIFAKGSNWIPGNILPEKGYEEKNIKFYLKSAKDVNMNMLRVWGGGLYESDVFYELADRYGILIWQDFMFACSMYPANDTFLKNVQTEVIQQIRRLQHHPSIAVWAGNNENEAALSDDWYGTTADFGTYKSDYVKLYVDTIKSACSTIDRTRPYVTSSPSNGKESETEGYIAPNPYSSFYGDVHYYNYILDGWDKSFYVKTRFASEYGFQSMPSYMTLQSATDDPHDLIYGSEFLEHRQHLTAGYPNMKLLIEKQIRLPDQRFKNYLKTFIYCSQIYQAQAIKEQTEFYRLWRSRVDAVGKGLTMGALYWQLNDVWQAPSWSSIDFGGRWKMLHYFAKKFFDKILITYYLDPARKLTLYVVSDSDVTIPNATVNIAVYKWTSLRNNGSKPLLETKKEVHILPGYSNHITDIWIDEFLMDAGCGQMRYVKQNCFVVLKLLYSNKTMITYENYVFPNALKYNFGIDPPNFRVKVLVSEDQENVPAHNYKIMITTDSVALFVWLETPKLRGIFSENGFLMYERTKNITYEINIPITAARLQKSLKITSLYSKEHFYKIPKIENFFF